MSLLQPFELERLIHKMINIKHAMFYTLRTDLFFILLGFRNATTLLQSPYTLVSFLKSISTNKNITSALITHHSLFGHFNVI